ncbi:MAG: hypothetical protein WDO70_01070 [Alphaproteobacteria bacterium]
MNGKRLDPGSMKFVEFISPELESLTPIRFRSFGDREIQAGTLPSRDLLMNAIGDASVNIFTFKTSTGNDVIVNAAAYDGIEETPDDRFTAVRFTDGTKQLFEQSHAVVMEACSGPRYAPIYAGAIQILELPGPAAAADFPCAKLYVKGRVEAVGAEPGFAMDILDLSSYAGQNFVEVETRTGGRVYISRANMGFEASAKDNFTLVEFEDGKIPVNQALEVVRRAFGESPSRPPPAVPRITDPTRFVS